MFRALITLLLLAYPVAVYFGLQWLSVRHVALVIIVLLLLRMTWMRQLRVLQGLQWPVLGGVALVVLALLFDSKLALKLYPAMVNTVLLGWFLLTLYQGPPAIERFARLQDPDLAESGVRYTRTVTKVWCGFFILNGGIALATALLGSDFWWMLYNGLIAYVLMGVLFAGEWLVRQKIRQRNAQS
ncbi:hypothetical protein [Permianibacter aggregans]|uniref:Putative membrane protein n=1 Tax=Permianibacter aggregans TaxID=1510150 RepID=A0A4R6ULW2_9GAMM|nr:hypothetical protein [Permianibacter aggregans]QGX40306.1 hypothetical protein E2H98_11740 [Permianibacter aggregans]TDQ44224.1 putative membrane protein [Permianibacter aggregans]